MKIKTSKLVFIGILVLLLQVIPGISQQKGDPNYKPKVDNPAYPPGKGPAVYIDEAHNNFHTLEGRYKPFAQLLKADGYRPLPFKEPFTDKSLAKVEILVISNALNIRNLKSWSLPTPSAFADKEIAVLKRWVKRGGSLFLIADHMPFPGCSEKLAAAFGFTFYNGFAMKKNRKAPGPSTFNLKNGTLKENAVTKGRNPNEKIDHVATFTGQAFKIPEKAIPILIFGDDHDLRFPTQAWKFGDNVKTEEAEGLCQGAVLSFDDGRLAVFGEAAQFTSQQIGNGPQTFGMTAPEAPQNEQLLLNTMHWLDGLL